MEKAVKARRQSTILQTAIPPKRGPAKHTETEGDLACTLFDSRGLVKEIKTPADAFRRVHEVMHATDTDCFEYPTVKQQVKDIVEDCRLHLLKWPWKGRETPQQILHSAVTVVNDDVELLSKAIKTAMPAAKEAASYSRFACSLRGQAIAAGLGEQGKAIPIMDVPPGQQAIVERCLHMIANGQHEEAAMKIQSIFFPVEEEKKSEKKKQEREEFLKSYTGAIEPPDAKDPKDIERHKEELKALQQKEFQRALDYHFPPDDKRMKIINLDLTVPTSHLTTGYRQATTGPRIYRPALRKPVLPQRIFYKPSPVSPKGTILFDSSGSMAVDDALLQECCLRAPTATIAYYFGTGGAEGYLVIYAKDGGRAKEIYPIEGGGNDIDGPALRWLMAQEGPRVFVTDRRFCGGYDANIAIAQLEHYEFCGDVEVIPSFSQFKEIYHPVENL